MSNQVFWSDKAKNDYKNILNYLNQNWSYKEVTRFAMKVEKDTLNLALHPETGAISKRKSIRRLVVSKQTSLYYKIIRGDIYIITLFDNRQNPEKLKL